MRPYWIIMKKRDGKALSSEEIIFMIDGYTKGTIPDYQMAAWMMAIFIQGMSSEESAALTQAMLDSGDRIDLSSIGKITVDKHSTGGVGDKVSLILAPLVASLGVPVPMMSGRGLGHTGGTLDKLEAIPGFRVDLSEEEFIRQVKEIGVAIIGQTKSLAPADKKMYALRDVTATVDSIPLIAGSIMSKKLAAGPDAFVFDVKTGNGAFMRTMESAEEMARTLVDIAILSGRQANALITDMNQPLGYCAGNALEIRETIACLKGEGPRDLMTVVMEIAGMMLLMGGRSSSIEEGKTLAQLALDEGKGLAKFKEMVATQGGDTAYIDNPDLFPEAGMKIPVPADRAGYIHGINTLEMGIICGALGAGREKVDDEIDMSAGIVFLKKVGDRVVAGESLLTLHTNREDSIEEIADRVVQAYKIEDSPCQPYPIIYKVVDQDGIRDYR
ncbi:MAG: pyrimidine-nucleoside phosphorylase [Candidatus Euphemobacter frigidus]|nr:pyrimidine-nucleoside phosphorylase [Candidatus Euphemobacter frigidus]MDP8275711.1 pyrimidine-nucleoside phosphorylase [Candidatus Euphemobacter frigidus]